MTDLELSEASKLLVDDRRRTIVALANEHGIMKSADLAASFGVSYMTILRDIKALEAEGRLRAVRGGAARLEQELPAEPFFKTKRGLNHDKKEAIAALAVQHFVRDNDIIIIEAGTTVLSMVRHLSHRNLTVITNGLEIISQVAPLVPNVTLIGCGGLLRDVSYTFVGPQAVQFFHSVRAKTLFVSATGLILPEGITDPNPLEIEVKRAMAASAERVVLLLDSSKFSVRSLSVVLPLDRIDVLITNSDAPPEYVEQLSRRMQVLLA
jgi:DeoR/GlpR family transcriptional regulator of sugar metabolism